MKQSSSKTHYLNRIYQRTGIVRLLMLSLVSVILPESVKESRIIACSLPFPFIHLKKNMQRVSAWHEKVDMSDFWSGLIWTQTDQTTLSVCGAVALMKGRLAISAKNNTIAKFLTVDGKHRLISMDQLMRTPAQSFRRFMTHGR